MSRSAFHRFYINCTVFAKRRVSENGFHQIDSAASLRFHETCDKGILYTNKLLRQSKRVQLDRTRCTQILDTRTRTALSN